MEVLVFPPGSLSDWQLDQPANLGMYLIFTSYCSVAEAAENPARAGGHP